MFRNIALSMNQLSKCVFAYLIQNICLFMIIVFDFVIVLEEKKTSGDMELFMHFSVLPKIKTSSKKKDIHV